MILCCAGGNIKKFLFVKNFLFLFLCFFFVSLFFLFLCFFCFFVFLFLFLFFVFVSFLLFYFVLFLFFCFILFCFFSSVLFCFVSFLLFYFVLFFPPQNLPNSLQSASLHYWFNLFFRKSFVQIQKMKYSSIPVFCRQLCLDIMTKCVEFLTFFFCR